jgi:hypothetical protein
MTRYNVVANIALFLKKKIIFFHNHHPHHTPSLISSRGGGKGGCVEYRTVQSGREKMSYLSAMGSATVDIRY